MGFVSTFSFEKRTIVIGRVGIYCGNVHIAPERSWISDNALYAKSFLIDDLVLEYLAAALAMANLNRLKKKSAQPVITQGAIYQQQIAIPPLPEQREIARILQTIDRKIETEEERKEALEALFRTLLHHLMTAKVRLTREFIARFEKGLEGTL